MAVLNLFGNSVTFVMKPVHGTSGFLRKVPSGDGSPAQWKAQAALAVAAHQSIGTLGKAQYKGKSMPAISARVARIVPQGKAGEANAGVHGGLSKSERRNRSHVGENRIQALVRKAGEVPMQQTLPEFGYGGY